MAYTKKNGSTFSSGTNIEPYGSVYYIGDKVSCETVGNIMKKNKGLLALSR